MSLKFKELKDGCLCMLKPYFHEVDVAKLPHDMELDTPLFYNKDEAQLEPVWWWWANEFNKKYDEGTVAIKFSDMKTTHVGWALNRFVSDSVDSKWIADVVAMSGLTRETWIQLFNLELKRRGKSDLITSIRPPSDIDRDFKKVRSEVDGDF